MSLDPMWLLLSLIPSGAGFVLFVYGKKQERMPQLVAGLVAADAAFYSAKNEAAATAKGVKRVCIPNRSTKSAERKREQKKRWFRQGQTWRTGCEGRISTLKRGYSWDRTRIDTLEGAKTWAGQGLFAHNLTKIAALTA